MATAVPGQQTSQVVTLNLKATSGVDTLSDGSTGIAKGRSVAWHTTGSAIKPSAKSYGIAAEEIPNGNRGPVIVSPGAIQIRLGATVAADKGLVGDAAGAWVEQTLGSQAHAWTLQGGDAGDLVLAFVGGLGYIPGTAGGG